MIFSAVKLIEIPVNGKGRYYLPDDRVLFGKKIQTIVPTQNIIPVLHNASSFVDYFYKTPFNSGDLSNTYISLTSDGQTMFYNNTLFAMSNFACLGKFETIDRTLSLPNCYIDVTSNIRATAQLVVFYEDKAAINSTRNIDSNFSSFEVTIGDSPRTKYFFGDNRILARKHFRNLLTNYKIEDFDVSLGFSSKYEQCTYITLCNGNNIIWDKMPIRLLNQIFNYKKLRFANIMFDFNNSYLEVSSDLTGVDDSTTINFTAEYER